MAFCYFIYLYLFCHFQLLSQCHPYPRDFPPGTTVSSWDFNDARLSWYDINGESTMSLEPLRDLVTPDTKILSTSSGPESRRTGDIFLFGKRPNRHLFIHNATVGPTILGHTGSNQYWRLIYAHNHTGPPVGQLNIDPPSPDPYSQLKDLAQDPLLAGVPTGLHSAVNPAEVFPEPAEKCNAACRLNIPVSMPSSHCNTY